MSFKDYFSRQASAYTRYRPGYPHQLFRYLTSQTPGRRLAWDCATGNGQVALALTRYFARVSASDASAAQIAQAVHHPGISYSVELAEQSSLRSASVDLLTVAQALHWFDRPRFYAEASRVLKPRGVIAAWCYTLCRVNDEVNQVLDRLYQDILGRFWPEGRHLIETRYVGLEFPFVELSPPPFHMVESWTLPVLLGYLSTWSAVQRYKDERQADPLELIAAELEAAWGGERIEREVRWEMGVRVGRAE